MMGTHQPQNELFNYQVNLDKRVRADHPLRRINAVVDLSFVRPAVEQFYGKNGHVGTDPVILVKMMLLLFLDDVPSERELMAVIRERLDYLWFLGYGLDDEVPNHSVLSKARARWGEEVFRDLFVRTVQQCVAAGLVEGKRLHIDSSLVRADASRDSIQQAPPELVAALRQAYEVEEQKLDERPSKGVNATHVSSTDPDATLARGGGAAVSQLSYKHHRVVDDAQGVITAVQTTTGQASDAAQLPKLLQSHEQNTGLPVQKVAGDKHYGTAANFRHCYSHQIVAHLGIAEAYVEYKGLFAVSEFKYEPEADRYRCPAGHYLYYYQFSKDKQMVRYRIEKAEYCRECPLRTRCTEGRDGRMIRVPIFAEVVAACKEQAQSPEAMYSRRRRKHVMEGSFADASNNHGLKRARWRRLWRQQIQDWLIAAVQNLRILLKKGAKLAGEGIESSTAAMAFVVRSICTLILLQSPSPQHPISTADAMKVCR